MRYYEIRYPDGEVEIDTSVRDLRDLPEGTAVYGVVTDRDGSLIDSWEIPVINGRPQVRGRSNRISQAEAFLGERHEMIAGFER